MFVIKSNYVASFKDITVKHGLLSKLKNDILSGKIKRELEKDSDVINCKINIQKIENNTIYFSFSIKLKTLRDGIKQFSSDWANLKEIYNSFQSNIKIYENEHILCEFTQNNEKTDFKLTENGNYYYDFLCTSYCSSGCSNWYIIVFCNHIFIEENQQKIYTKNNRNKQRESRKQSL